MKFQKSLTISILVVNSPILARNISKRSLDVCEEEFAVSGPCRAIYPSWSFNKLKGKCEKFNYGGCIGNGNRFDTRVACENKCLKLPDDVLSFFMNYRPETKYEPENRCFEPRYAGKKGWHAGIRCVKQKRYYFNSSIERCVLFYYNGCKGNSNNFVNIKECENACIKKREMVNDHSVEPEEEEEETYEEGPQEEEIITKVDKCKQKTDMGVGRLALERWSYNTFHKKCTKFVYFGSGGNSNRFMTETDCKIACMPLANRSGFVSDFVGDEEEEEEQNEEIVKNCSDNLKTGMCRAYIKRYGFDTEIGACKQFTYGGCGENGNNYKSMEECENKCHIKRMVHDNVEEEEEEEEEKGFSSIIKNNFEDEMQPNTEHLPDACRVQMRSFPCRAQIPRYSYVHGEGCKLFYWGGCEPNANNFLTMSACRLKCTIVNDNLEEEEEEEVVENDQEEETVEEETEEQETEEEEVINPFKDTIQENASHLPKACQVMYKSWPCRAAIDRWAYDAAQGRCVKFTWGGCQPNSNNFRSITECKLSCEKSNNSIMLHDGDDEEEEEEENLEENQEENTNEQSDISADNNRKCSLPKSAGHKVCAKRYGKSNRYYFDKNWGTCKLFKFNGCQKNENNFLTMNECRNTCKNMPTSLRSGNIQNKANSQNNGLSNYNPFQTSDFGRLLFGFGK